MIVFDKNGLQGTIAQEDLPASFRQGEILVHFQNGQRVLIPADLFVLSNDGTYRLPVAVSELITNRAATGIESNAASDTDSVVVPIVEERLSVQKQLRETGVVEIRKTVHEHTETVNPALASQEVEIERIPINRVVEQPIPIRYEGDTMIISLLEEVFVVEKRLVLREEVHVKQLHKEVFDPQEVLLREERVEITRRGADPSQP